MALTQDSSWLAIRVEIQLISHSVVLHERSASKYLVNLISRISTHVAAVASYS